MTKLESVFVRPEVKRLIELHKNLGGFKENGKAIEDLLNDSGKYKKMIEINEIIKKKDNEEEYEGF